MDTKPSKAFSSIIQGLSEALKFALGSESKAIVRKPARDETNELIGTDLGHNSGSIESTKRSPSTNHT